MEWTRNRKIVLGVVICITLLLIGLYFLQSSNSSNESDYTWSNWSECVDGIQTRHTTNPDRAVITEQRSCQTQGKICPPSGWRTFGPCQNNIKVADAFFDDPTCSSMVRYQTCDVNLANSTTNQSADPTALTVTKINDITTNSLLDCQTKIFKQQVCDTSKISQVCGDQPCHPDKDGCCTCVFPCQGVQDITFSDTEKQTTFILGYNAPKLVPSAYNGTKNIIYTNGPWSTVRDVMPTNTSVPLYTANATQSFVWPSGVNRPGMHMGTKFIIDREFTITHLGVPTMFIGQSPTIYVTKLEHRAQLPNQQILDNEDYNHIYYMAEVNAVNAVVENDMSYIPVDPQVLPAGIYSMSYRNDNYLSPYIPIDVSVMDSVITTYQGITILPWYKNKIFLGPMIKLKQAT